MHRLIRRQIRKHLGEGYQIPEGIAPLFAAISDAYEQHDADRKLLERSMEISSDELLRANEQLKAEADTQRLILTRLKSSVRALNHNHHADDLDVVDVLSVSHLLQEQIEQRMMIEGALREREQRLQLILTASPDAILTLDPDGTITSWNEGATRMTGYLPSEAIGQATSFLFPNGETDDAELEEAALAGYASLAGWRKRKDDTLFWAEATLAALRDDSGRLTGYVRIARDMTARRRDEEALRKTKEAAESASRAKSMFLANMSHEIRTPMNAVIGMTGLLEESNLTPDQREMVETIQSSGSALLSLINDILDLSKIEAGKIRLDVKRFDFHKCVSSSVEVFSPLVKNTGVDLRMDYKDSVPRFVEADETRIRQILFNLIGNAVKFTNSGEIAVVVGARSMNHVSRFHVSVRDTGIGIPSEMKSTIFKPFSQVESVYTRDHGGTGLGLAISKRLVQALGGEIWVESQPGVGSTFNFTFMTPETSQKKAVRAVAPDRAPVGPRGRMKVLVAEDNPTNRKVISKLLERMGQPADLVENGQQAVDAVREGSFDVVFMDVQMPVMNGLDATKGIRQLEQRQPHIVALTANAMPEDRSNCLRAGMDDYLAKPIVLSDLKRVLASIEKERSRPSVRPPVAD